MSLKQKLFNEIKLAGYKSLDEIYSLVREGETMYKTSTAERRLRELCENGFVKPVYDKGKKYIIGYEYVEPIPTAWSEPLSKLEQVKLL